MRKRQILSILILLTLLLAGCGEKPQAAQGTDSPVQSKQENTEEGADIFYAIEETSLPDPDRAIKTLLGEEKFAAEDPVLHGDRVYRVVYVFDEDGNHKENYLQILKLSEMEWKNISASEEFAVEGKRYRGYREPVFSENGEVYRYLYDVDQPENYYLGSLGENGIEEIICPVPSQFYNDDAAYESKLVCDKNGAFYYFYESKDTVALLDGLLQAQKQVKLPGTILNILQADGEADTCWYGANQEGKVTIRNIKDDKILLDGFEGISADAYKAEFSSEGSLFLADARAVYKMDEEPRLLFRFIERDYIVNSLYSMEAGENGEMQLLVKLDGEYALLRLKAGDSPRTAQKQEIVIAFAMEHLALNKTIARFNRQSDKYHITVMLPGEQEEWAAFRDRIQLEMSAGRGPDMLGHDVILDITPYVENGYLECLDGVLLDESAYLQAALEGCRIDGKLYGLPYDCTLHFAAYPQALTGGNALWTLPQMMDAVQACGAKILQKGCGGLDIVLRYALYDNSNTTYIDWEKGESHLTEAPFLELLAFAKKYADTGELPGEEGELIEAGEACAVEVSMEELYWMNALNACFQGAPAIIGYPRAEGNGIYVSCRELYVNSSSACKEGAEEFLRYLLSEEVQEKYVMYDVYEEMDSLGVRSLYGHKANFPVSFEAYDRLMEKAGQARGDKTYKAYSVNFGVEYEDTAYTQEQVEQFYFLLENAQPDNYKVLHIYGMVSEELAPYFAGDITAEQAAEILDNRVQLYLDERAD